LAGIGVFPEFRGSPFQPRAKIVIMAQGRKSMIGAMSDSDDDVTMLRKAVVPL